MKNNILVICICFLVLISGLVSCKGQPVGKDTSLNQDDISEILSKYTMVGVGDSLMYGTVAGESKKHDSFCEYLTADYGVTALNYSVGGGGGWGIVDTDKRFYRNRLKQVMKDTENGKEYDILLLEGGFNTLEMLKSAKPNITEPSELIGNVEELEELSKMSGMIENNVSVVYDYFHTSNRYIFYIFPALNPEMKKSEEMQACKELMLSFCKLKGIVMIDLGEAGLEYSDTYYSDEVHYTDAGYRLTSDYIAKVIAETITQQGK